MATSRTVEQDPQYAIRLLVDAAIRALSPAINDPTTAVQALDQIEDLLRRLGGRQLDHGQAFDPLGMLRLTFLVPTWEDYLALSFDEIRQYGATGQRAARAAGRSLTVIPSTPAAPLFAHHRSHCRRYVFRRTDYLHQVLRHCRTFAFVRRRDRLHRLAPFRVGGFTPSIQVVRRLRAALVGIADTIVVEARREVVRRYLDHLNLGVGQSAFDDRDQATASQEDRQGLGHSRKRPQARSAAVDSQALHQVSQIQ
ncbi:MAG: DUF2254 family protein [Acetobacteraceae bacterium]